MNVPKIRFETFTEEWRETSIGQVAHIIGGGTPSTSNIHYWGGDIQWFTPSEVGHCKYVNKSERTISELGLNESSAKLLPANSILLSSRATIGEMSINTCECSTNQGFQSLVPYNADLEFLFYIMHTKKNDLIRESNGSTFLEISANKVRSLGLVVPKRNEQEKIGLFLKNIDSSIETLSKKITLLKQTKQACLQSMFPQLGETKPRVRFKGFEEDWEPTLVGDCGTWSKGRLLSKEDITPKGESKCIHYGELFTLYGEVINNVRSKTNLQQGCVSQIGDILFPDSDVTPTGLARCSALMEEGVVLGGGINILKPYKHIHPPFLSYSINMEKEQIISRVTGTTVRHINSRALSDIVVMLPTAIKEQQALANYFSNLDKQITLQAQRLEKLKQIKSACLDNMFV